MERNIPHVLDIFVSSPGERRRILAKEREEEKFARQLKDQQKNPGSDSAVCLCSSSDEDERNISRYFDYLNDDELENTSSAPKKKKSSKAGPEKKGPQDGEADPSPQQKLQKTPKEAAENKEKVKRELEKDIKQIERHLSMKKTIRKKMMRDLQQAFVEDPKEFQQDPECIPPERKNNINIQNLTISKRRLSKSEHSFLDMLKENENKDRKSYGRSAPSESKTPKNYAHSHSKRSATPSSSRNKHHEDDSGNDSPTRGEGPPSHHAKHPKEKASVPPPKEEKKASFWQRLTGKGKSKR